eukprot:8550-Heterococcus_DN1.PRE.3
MLSDASLVGACCTQNDMTSAIKFFEEGGDPNVSAQRDSYSFEDELRNAHSLLCLSLVFSFAGAMQSAYDSSTQSSFLWPSGHVQIPA